MEQHNINSTHIKYIVYNINELYLDVHFNDGTIYEYFPFYENQLKSFLTSDSKGKWFLENVKKNKTIRYKKKK